jgi:hypothetical protein
LRCPPYTVTITPGATECGKTPDHLTYIARNAKMQGQHNLFPHSSSNCSGCRPHTPIQPFSCFSPLCPATPHSPSQVVSRAGAPSPLVRAPRSHPTPPCVALHAPSTHTRLLIPLHTLVCNHCVMSPPPPHTHTHSGCQPGTGTLTISEGPCMPCLSHSLLLPLPPQNPVATLGCQPGTSTLIVRPRTHNPFPASPFSAPPPHTHTHLCFAESPMHSLCRHTPSTTPRLSARHRHPHH